jgi:hypothetical protein
MFVLNSPKVDFFKLRTPKKICALKSGECEYQF